MTIIQWEKDETVAVVKMDNAENRQNLEFAQRLNEVLDEVVADTAVTALVLTSTDPKSWSLGVDVNWVATRLQEQAFQDVKDFMYGMNEVFKKLMLIPIPTIAAISGHAFGNGAILACACDFRFMRADRGFFCFPEVDLGIPFLPGMIAFVKKSLPYPMFNELKLTGRRATAAELEAVGAIQKAGADSEASMQDALAFAKTFQKKRGIFGEHKKRLHKSIVDTMEKEDPSFIDALFLFIQD